MTTTTLARKISTFSDKQRGFSVGGPAVKNRAFFFVSFDSQRQETPSGVSIDTTGNLFGNRALVESFVNTLKTKYTRSGPNPFDEFIKQAKSDKTFIRGTSTSSAGSS